MINNENPVILTKLEKILCLSFAVIAFCAPWLLTRSSLYFGISFEDTGQIGDTIGGITAPIIGLLAAFLVYKSFEAQIKANYVQQQNHKEQLEIQQKNHEEQISILSSDQYSNYLLKLYAEIESDYIKNERENANNGWANQLSQGIGSLESLPDDSSKWVSSTMKNRLESGRANVSDSIGKILFAYHNFKLLLASIDNALDKSRNRNVIIVSRYVTSKLDNLFNQNSYNVLLTYSFAGWENDNRVDSSTLNDLNQGVAAADEINEYIKKIIDKTSWNNVSDVS